MAATRSRQLERTKRPYTDASVQNQTGNTNLRFVPDNVPANGSFQETGLIREL